MDECVYVCECGMERSPPQMSCILDTSTFYAQQVVPSRRTLPRSLRARGRVLPVFRRLTEHFLD